MPKIVNQRVANNVLMGVKISPNLRELIKRESKSLGISDGELVRRILVGHFEKKPPSKDPRLYVRAMQVRELKK